MKTGRQLDLDTTIPANRLRQNAVGDIEQTHYDSIGYNRFVEGCEAVSFHGLIHKLATLALEARDALADKVKGNWTITGSKECDSKENFVPIAFNDGKCAWYREVDGKLEFSHSITAPSWKDEGVITWRDWEDIGFRFVNQPSGQP